MDPSTTPPEAALLKPPSRWRRMFRRVARIVLLVYVLLCLIMYFIQDSIIFPGHSTQGHADAVIRPSSGYELVPLTTADGIKTVALYGAAESREGTRLPTERGRVTLLFFYGNGMCLADSFAELNRFRRLGVNVLIPEYPGYGMAEGKPSERALYGAAEAAYAHLLTRSDVDPAKIIAGGWSLGGAVATEVATHHPVAGLATFSAFTTMPDMAHAMMPWLPTSLLLSYKFDNERKFAGINCPIFIAHGREDHLVPFEMSERLARAAGHTRVTKVAIDSDHNNIFEQGGDDLMAAFGEFAQRVVETTQP